MVGFGRNREIIKGFFGFHYRATHEANVRFRHKADIDRSILL
jgi:hypothetical protein